MIELRDYQQRGFAEIQQAYRDKFKAPLYVLPTGGGKTVLFVAIAQSAMQRGKRVLILVHRQELLDQVCATLTQFGIPHGVIAASYEGAPRHAVQVASVMSLIRRLDKTPTPDLCIWDEAHHCVAETYRKIIRHFPQSRILGVTATPTAQGLGEIFDTLILGPSVAELTERGYLAPARVFAPPTINTQGMHTLMGEYLPSEIAERADKPSVTGDAIKHYQRLAPGRKAAVFCCSLKHADNIAAAAREAGISALCIDGTMAHDIRRQIVADFAAGKIKWLISCAILAEGFDCPDIEVGIFLRPTQSEGLWIQQMGRCLRVAPGKTSAILIDHAGNSTKWGHPDDARDWARALTATPERKGKPAEKPPSYRVCAGCHASNHLWRKECRECGAPFEVAGREVRQVEGELEEVTRRPLDATKRKIGPEIWKAAVAGDVATLHAIAKARHYDPGVVKHWMRVAGRKHLGKVMRG